MEAWADIRYQLLTAICGTALQSQRDGSTLAVFVVHEFHTQLTTQENLKRNESDYQSFLQVIGEQESEDSTERLHGPFVVAGVECFVGKVVTPGAS